MSLVFQRCSGLSEPRLRLAWLCAWAAERSASELAPDLEQALEAADADRVRGTATLVTLVAWSGSGIQAELLRQTARCTNAGSLPRLGRLLDHSAECDPEQEPKAKTTVPDYGPGKALTLGARKTLARHPDRREMDRLIRDPHPAVIEQLLKNPRLTEPDLVRLVTARPARAKALCHLFRDATWLSSRRIRNGILHNPTVALWQSAPLLCLCQRQDLQSVTMTPSLPKSLLSLARAYLAQRPPLARGVCHPTLQ